VVVIILLAIVLGIYTAFKEGRQDIVPWQEIIVITTKSVLILLGFVLPGLWFSQTIGNFLKLFKNKYIITFLAFGLALFVSAVFEKVGLAMIIGAYVTGLSLSKTDISFLIQETLHPIERFFVPIFFAVMGMKINLGTLLFTDIFLYGLIFTLIAILAKVIGCGITSLFFNFNKLGAVRIGFGMAPRGEVALIIAGIGLSAGLLDEKAFSIAILMIVFTTLISPQILNSLLKSKQKGVRKEYKVKGIVLIPYELPEEEETDFLVSYIIKSFYKEGFFINKRALDNVIYEIRKNDVFIKLFVENKKIIFKTSEEDASLVKAVVYESFLKLDFTVSKLKAISKPLDMRKDLVFSNTKKYKIDLTKMIDPNCIILELKSHDKEHVIEELVSLLYMHKKITDKQQVLTDILVREKSMSTGMQYGLAIPHIRTNQTDVTSIAIGLSQTGIEFDSIDGLPAKIIICLVSSTKDNDPHIQILATISAFLNSKEAILKMLTSTTEKEIWSFFLTEEQKNLIYYEYIYNSLDRNMNR
jgi:mannitol/fructose-specific phosphotransferase system IIA component (Ntr-type)